MARLRIWFRRHVRGLLRTTDDKPSPQGRRKSTPNVPIKDIPISAPILVSHDGVNFKIPATRPRPRPQSLPLLNFNGPNLAETLRHSSTEFTIIDLKDLSIDDTHSIASPSTVAEEEDIEAAPSLCSDSDDEDVMPEHLWPATPTSPARHSRRPSFFQVIGAGPHAPQVQVMTSRPQSFMDATNLSDAGDMNRLSRYSVMSRESERRSKRASVMSRSSSKKDRRASMLSQSSARNKRRASVMSIGAAKDGVSPGAGEWEDTAASRRFSRRMSWGFETYATHTSTYTPMRI
ncbi:hypothetical protein IQ06DRAFT_374248 [Phaeosphaeriaceae sp. SRC1lsM3a]|nr:hypothetical protein IQ06DRAFT_374248 [Stagonospora sp. SRC1lsM3a]